MQGVSVFVTGSIPNAAAVNDVCCYLYHDGSAVLLAIKVLNLTPLRDKQVQVQLVVGSIYKGGGLSAEQPRNNY